MTSRSLGTGNLAAGGSPTMAVSAPPTPPAGGDDASTSLTASSSTPTSSSSSPEADLLAALSEPSLAAFVDSAVLTELSSGFANAKRAGEKLAALQRQTDADKERGETVSDALATMRAVQVYRGRILLELLSTERLFLADMAFVAARYHNKHKAAALSKDEYASMFRHLQPIINSSAALLRLLHSELFSESTSNIGIGTGVGAALCAWLADDDDGSATDDDRARAKRVKCQLGMAVLAFTTYGSASAKQLTVYEALRAQHETFAELERSLKRSCRGLLLDSFFMAPMQRVCRYPLLIRDLSKQSVKLKEALQALVDEQNEEKAKTGGSGGSGSGGSARSMPTASVANLLAQPAVLVAKLDAEIASLGRALESCDRLVALVNEEKRRAEGLVALTALVASAQQEGALPSKHADELNCELEKHRVVTLSQIQQRERVGGPMHKMIFLHSTGVRCDVGSKSRKPCSLFLLGNFIILARELKDKDAKEKDATAGTLALDYKGFYFLNSRTEFCSVDMQLAQHQGRSSADSTDLDESPRNARKASSDTLNAGASLDASGGASRSPRRGSASSLSSGGSSGSALDAGNSGSKGGDAASSSGGGSSSSSNNNGNNNNNNVNSSPAAPSTPGTEKKKSNMAGTAPRLTITQSARDSTTYHHRVHVFDIYDANDAKAQPPFVVYFKRPASLANSDAEADDARQREFAMHMWAWRRKRELQKSAAKGGGSKPSESDETMDEYFRRMRPMADTSATGAPVVMVGGPTGFTKSNNDELQRLLALAGSMKSGDADAAAAVDAALTQLGPGASGGDVGGSSPGSLGPNPSRPRSSSQARGSGGSDRRKSIDVTGGFGTFNRKSAAEAASTDLKPRGDKDKKDKRRSLQLSLTGSNKTKSSKSVGDGESIVSIAESNSNASSSGLAGSLSMGSTSSSSSSASSSSASTSSLSQSSDDVMRINGHEFRLVYLTKPTYCARCAEFIWGVFEKQGYTCSRCKFPAHKDCVGKVTQTCTGVVQEWKKPKKDKPEKKEKKKEKKGPEIAISAPQ